MSITRSELYIEMGDWTKNKAAFDVLLSNKEAIEAEFGEPLVWSRRDDIRASRIYVKVPGSLDDSDADLHRYREWFVEKAITMKHVFADRVKTIDLSAVVTAPEETAP